MNRQKLLVFGLAAALTAYAPLLLYWQRGLKAAFQYFAGDAFYYLAVARHSVGAGFFTFDGQHATNGFHPLWQWLLTALFSLPSLHDQPAQIQTTFFLSIALVSIGIGLTSAAAYALTRNTALALLGTVPGLFYVLMSPVEPQFGNPWAFANGMESPLTIMLLGSLLAALPGCMNRAKPDTRRTALVSLLLTLLVLARLDDGFIIPPVAALVAAAYVGWRRKTKAFAAVCALPFLALLGYGLYNLTQVGTVLPVSGLSKGGSALLGNLLLVAATFVPVLQFGNLWIGTWQATAWRALQLVVPMVIAWGWLWYYVRGLRNNRTESKDRPYEAVLTALAAYVVLKGAYNLINVALGFQGHWYYPASLMTANLIGAVAIQRSLRLSPRAGTNGWALTASALAVVLFANGFTNAKRLTDYNGNFYTFWEGRQVITTALNRLAPGSGIIDEDDGILGYALDVPAMSGLGYALDLEGHLARREGRLLELAYARGFRVLASLNYFSIAPEADSQAIRQSLASTYFMSTEALDDWNFTVLFRNPATGTAFIKFEPVSGQ